MQMKTFIRNLVALAMGCFIAILILEIFLRFFNPLPVRVKNNEIILPANRVFTFENTHIPDLDKKIVHTKNSLGFRGEEIPLDFEDHTSVIVVGGSTTECRFLSDGMDWVSLWGEKVRDNHIRPVWFNNAGLDGHSTFGHRVLLNEYLAKLQPNFIVYLIGVNEIGRADLHQDDMALMKNQSFSILDWLKKNSEIALLANNLRRSLLAYQIDLGHGNLDLKKAEHKVLDSLEVAKEVAHHQVFLADYEKRLTQLVEDTKKYNIQPILLSQPLLFGEGTDDVTDVNLETIQTRFQNGKAYWQVLEAYNNVSRKVAIEQNIIFLDLAYHLPKSSLYFYDGMHFTNEGAMAISDILYKELYGIFD